MVAMLEHMDEEGKTYVLLRTGTNTASRFSFILEGIKRSDPIPLDQSVATFVNKKK